MLVAVFDAGTEYIVMADFFGQILPVGLFVFPVFTEQTCGKHGGIFVFASVILDFNELVDLLKEHVVRGDALGILENAQ